MEPPEPTSNVEESIEPAFSRSSWSEMICMVPALPLEPMLARDAIAPWLVSAIVPALTYTSPAEPGPNVDVEMKPEFEINRSPAITDIDPAFPDHGLRPWDTM